MVKTFGGQKRLTGSEPKTTSLICRQQERLFTLKHGIFLSVRTDVRHVAVESYACVSVLFFFFCRCMKNETVSRAYKSSAGRSGPLI